MVSLLHPMFPNCVPKASTREILLGDTLQCEAMNLRADQKQRKPFGGFFRPNKSRMENQLIWAMKLWIPNRPPQT